MGGILKWPVKNDKRKEKIPSNAKQNTSNDGQLPAETTGPIKGPQSLLN